MKASNIKDLDFNKGNRLIPVVVQNFKSKNVLMLAYVNEEALRMTLESGFAHYWSRSRRTLWMKGESSGYVQRIREIKTDCDYDSLLFLVEQKGNVCHTGDVTCFHNRLEGAINL